MDKKIGENMVFVKIGREGGKVTEYIFNDGITLREVLSKGLITLASDEIITTEGYPPGLQLDYRIVSANNIFIIKKLVPQVTVRVSRIGQTLRQIIVPRNSSIGNVLVKVAIVPQPNEDIWIHRDGIDRGVKKTVNDIVQDGDIIVIEPKKTMKAKITELLNSMADFEIDDDIVEDYTERMLQIVREG